ncbi:hypothetical protein [Nostoc sp.]
MGIGNGASLPFWRRSLKSKTLNKIPHSNFRLYVWVFCVACSSFRF